MMKKSLLWLWNASKGIRFRLLLNGFLGISKVIAGLVFIYVSKLLIDMVTSHSPASSRLFLFYSISLVVLIIFEISTGIITTWLGNQTEIKLKNKIRQALFVHLMSARWGGKRMMHSGDMLNRLEEDVRVVCDTLCNSVPSLIVTMVQLITAFVFLCQLSSTMAVIIIFILPFFLLVSKIYIKRTRQLTLGIRKSDSQIQCVLQESLQHRIVIQTMEQNETIADKLRKLQNELYNRTMHRTRFNLFSRSMVTIGFAAGYLVSFLWSVQQLYVGAITFGVMTAFLQLVGQIQRPTMDLSRQIPSFIHASTSVDRLLELESIPIEEYTNPIHLSGIAGIRMKNVTFHYSKGERNILSNFSHDFIPGSHSAIIGETGSGKSTTIRLMLSLLHPSYGDIEIYNNMGVSVLANTDSRCNLVYVPQGNSLFSGTIRDNLKLGNPLANDQEMFNALHIAAADFVEGLPLGLDTICGEQGSGLSEGQSQRIAIARALLREGSILLFDELSSSLDYETEQVLMNRLMAICKDKTMIFVTHHEKIVDYCDDVVRLT